MLSMQLLTFCTNLSRKSCKQIHFWMRRQTTLAIPQTKLCTSIKQRAFIPPHGRTHRSSLVPGLSAGQYGYIITWVREWRLVYTKFRCFPLALPKLPISAKCEASTLLEISMATRRANFTIVIPCMGSPGDSYIGIIQDCTRDFT